MLILYLFHCIKQYKKQNKKRKKKKKKKKKENSTLHHMGKSFIS